MIDQAGKLRAIARRLKNNRYLARKNKNTRRIAITSGKGGVGKSSFSLSLAVAMAKLKQKVLVIDADINLGNLDILLGLNPEFMLRDVIEGRIELKELLIQAPGGITIMPASSGDIELLKRTDAVRYKIEEELAKLELNYDFVIIDTGAGIGDEVIDFSLNSDEIIIVTTTEPTAFTDAYAVVKVLASKSFNLNFKLMVNMVSSESEGKAVFDRIEMVVNHFLQQEIKYVGSLLRDRNVINAIKSQTPFFLFNDKIPASRSVWEIAKKLIIDSRKLMNNDNGDAKKPIFGTQDKK